MIGSMDTLEHRRVSLQTLLDAEKTLAERNRLGQFATPSALAVDILKYAAALLPGEKPVRFLDPAFGTGAFYSALRSVVPDSRVAEAVGFEIDPHYARPASKLWAESGLVIKSADFTQEPSVPRFNLVICNPPYVRHHHIPSLDKARLQLGVRNACGMKMGGLSGLYCYFLGLSHGWMAEGAVAGWLIPSEFMDVNYGTALKRYLLERVTLLQIHRFDPADVQFSDALVSSAIVWFRKSPPPMDHTVTFSFGGRLSGPAIRREVSAVALSEAPKWTRFPVLDVRKPLTGPVLSHFFGITRGVATGDNGYFILGAESIASHGLPMNLFRPILPGPRHLAGNEILSDDKGRPVLDRRLFLLDTRLPEEVIRDRFPTLYYYLQYGRSRGVHERYLCRHRTPWYSQEDRAPAPIVCTYLGRRNVKSGRPFRFILNMSKAIVPNVYLGMYPTPALARAMERDSGLIRRVWEALNQITPDQLLGAGRVYGGGLHKLEPHELGRVDASSIAELIPEFRPVETPQQFRLFGGPPAPGIKKGPQSDLFFP